MTGSESEPLAVVVGRNCRRIRTEAGVTQNVLAKRARDAGLRWTASKVGDFEAGRTSPTFATILAAASALCSATESDVALADLVASEGFVSITDVLDPIGSVLQQLIRGERSWRHLKSREVGHTARMLADPDFRAKMDAGLRALAARPLLYPNVPTTEYLAILKRSGLDEDRVAKRLDVDDDVLASASWQLWRRTFSEERDRLAGPGANAQKRGQVSRQLQKDLRAEIDRERSNGND